jgi:hypothetical protein
MQYEDAVSIKQLRIESNGEALVKVAMRTSLCRFKTLDWHSADDILRSVVVLFTISRQIQKQNHDHTTKTSAQKPFPIRHSPAAQQFDAIYLSL